MSVRAPRFRGPDPTGSIHAHDDQTDLDSYRANSDSVASRFSSVRARAAGVLDAGVMTVLDWELLREVAAEFGYWTATTKPAYTLQYRRQDAEL